MYDNKGNIDNNNNRNNNTENVSISGDRIANRTSFFFTNLLGEAECIERLNRTATKFEPGKYCPGTFDGWLCWPDTAAGSTAYERCPDFVTGFEPSRYAHKECGHDGEWFRHPLTNKTWSNYTKCVNIDDLELKHSVNLIYISGYSISLVAILLSLAILGYFKSLRCARITLHMNLFISFAANNSLWLLWYLVVMPDAALLRDNPPSCIALHIVLHYFLLTNYSWMLCEGFYLHTVLVAAFISEKKLVKWLIAFGWGTPAILLDESYKFREYLGCACLHFYVFKFNIFVQYCARCLAEIECAGQPASATLLLVPLLGLQYILIPFRPDPGHSWEHTYEVISALVASFQGLCVATFFCFFNSEVIAQVKHALIDFFKVFAFNCDFNQLSFTSNSLYDAARQCRVKRKTSSAVSHHHYHHHWHHRQHSMKTTTKARSRSSVGFSQHQQHQEQQQNQPAFSGIWNCLRSMQLFRRHTADRSHISEPLMDEIVTLSTTSAKTFERNATTSTAIVAAASATTAQSAIPMPENSSINGSGNNLHINSLTTTALINTHREDDNSADNDENNQNQ
uniref:Calcitonin receptor n=1 Tax=Glossina morsitans morsitans TaxID=37546 RepID=A0A1B0GC90_GLOMM